jgi:hypothetical protein
MSLIKNRAFAAIGTFIITGIFLLIEHFNGGVVAHHLLAREDLPEISNYWGLLTVPLLTWITVSMFSRREHRDSITSSVALIRFLSALAYGILLTLLWELGAQDLLQYFILFPLLVAIFKPVHFSECLLGFVIGMMYAFGGVLPIIIGLVLMAISFVINKFIRGIKALIG